MMVLSLVLVFVTAALAVRNGNNGTMLQDSSGTVSVTETGHVTDMEIYKNELDLMTIEAVFSLFILSGIIFVLISTNDNKRRPRSKYRIY